MTKPRIGIVVSSTRPGRFADKPVAWLQEIVRAHKEAHFEVVDLRDYPMPLFEEKTSPAYGQIENEIGRRFATTMESLDGYIFITAEYNHSITGALKNALDYLATEVHRKPAAFVGYGGVGGARAVEHLRHILAEMRVAGLKHAVHIAWSEMLPVMKGETNLSSFPHLNEAARLMLEELSWWAETLKAGRRKEAEPAELAQAD